MRINQNNIIDLIKKNNIKALLIYGPDKGAISITLDKIVKEIGAVKKEDKASEYRGIFRRNEDEERRIFRGLDYSEIKHCLLVLLNSCNLFNNKEVVFISNCPTAIDIDIKSALNEDFNHFPIFIADELPPSSSFRQFFEKEDKIGALACYQETFTNTKKYILQYISSKNKSITIDAARFLAENLKADKLLVDNELSKLITFYNDKNNIDLVDVRKCVYIGLSPSFDMLCIYFAKKQLHEYLNELSKLLDSGAGNISILRSLARYYMNLYLVKTKGENHITQIKPPIFFLYLEDFKNVVRATSKKETIRVLKLLFDFEVAIKESNSYTDICYELFVRAHYDKNVAIRNTGLR